ncbi:MAG: hypothetical protein ACI9KN_002040 [Gammaproteobacteria bacterium]|jgi:hypothetical protein
MQELILSRLAKFVVAKQGGQNARLNGIIIRLICLPLLMVKPKINYRCAKFPSASRLIIAAPFSQSRPDSFTLTKG